MKPRVLAVVGSYRKGHTIHQAAREILAGAEKGGAETAFLDLLDVKIEFCTNCRHCTQEPGPVPGPCVLQDEMAAVIDEMERADALVFASPVNAFAATALFKRFQERLVGYAYWPWETPSPKMRRPEKTKKAVLVTSTAMPSLMARWTTHAMKTLQVTADMIGAKPVARLFIGLAALRRDQELPDRVRRRARRYGEKLLPG